MEGRWGSAEKPGTGSCQPPSASPVPYRLLQPLRAAVWEERAAPAAGGRWEEWEEEEGRAPGGCEPPSLPAPSSRALLAQLEAAGAEERAAGPSLTPAVFVPCSRPGKETLPVLNLSSTTAGTLLVPQRNAGGAGSWSAAGKGPRAAPRLPRSARSRAGASGLPRGEQAGAVPPRSAPQPCPTAPV